jgi:lysophospholipase L1-like esterase
MKAGFHTVFCCLVFAISAFAQAQPNSAIHAKPRDKEFDWMSISQWYHKHADHVAIAREGKAELIFLGDSITESWNWGEQQQAIFQQYFGRYPSANFGIGGDQTQNLLWRLQNGLKGQLKPKLVIVLIGVNNFGHSQHSPEQVAEGVAAVVEQALANYPDAYVLVSGVFPFDEKADSPNRSRVTALNALLSNLSALDRVWVKDLGAVFIESDGSIDKNIMGDFLHPSAAGLERYAKKLAPVVDDLIARYDANHSFVPASHERIQVIGRSALLDGGERRLSYPGVRFNLKVKAKKISLRASSQGTTYLDLLVDGKFKRTIALGTGEQDLVLFESEKVRKHTISLINRSETWHGVTTIAGFDLLEGKLLKPKALAKKKLLVIGDSVTCGENIDRKPLNAEGQCQKDNSTWNARESYGLRLGDSLNAQTHLVCYGGRGLIRSWNGRRDELNAADYYRLAIPVDANQYPWQQAHYQADLILVSLGTNDFSYSAGEIPQREEYVSAYESFLKTLLNDHPKAQIALTEGAILNDDDPKRMSKSTLRSYMEEAISKVDSGRVHIVGSNYYGGDDCDAHPNKAQHAQMAKDFYEPMKKLLK